MKKMLVAMSALALVAQAVSAADVYSSNIVGYTKLTLPQGFNQLALNFDEVAGGAMDLQDVIPGTTVGLLKGSGVGVADNIQIWNLAQDKYDVYFLHDGVGKGNAEKANKWVDNATGNVASNVMVSAATGFFYVNNNTGNETVAVDGQVVADDPKNWVIPQGFNMLASPFTADWYVNGMDENSIAQPVIVDWATSTALKGSGVGVADNIQIWNLAQDKYDVYFLHDGVGKGNAEKANKWVDNATGNVATGLVVQVGQGFFYVNNAASDLTLTCTPPYSF